ncbi:MAG TPA: alkaline phosphatase family protein [Candidatus Nitrosotalea sp.]|nr:alkaline phosphatase family protein [Candidatus Nitrosotalea sp.]
MTKILAATLIGLLATSLVLSSSSWALGSDPRMETKTPIKHVVVIFQENISYDHYFGTYPNAVANFTAKPNTPSSNNYLTHPSLLTNNPNLAQPFLLTKKQAITCDEDHEYLAEQKAYDGGLVDKFVQETGNGEVDHGVLNCGAGNNGNLTMGYYDGSTVTGIWNMAQNFAMSDNSYDTTFGPSTPGALNLISGQTFGATEDAVGGGAAISDTDGAYDDCSSTSFPTIAMSGKNVGDLLNAKGITWGWFQGGFAPSTPWDGNPAHKAVCGVKTPRTATDNALVAAYSAHHEPFQYFASTSNPHHLPPSSDSMIGKTDQANHQYDLGVFWTAVKTGNLPAVSFLKAPRAEDGHPGNSDPLDEQVFIANVTNTLENSQYWPSTAEVILYDDSDGWYDHVMPPIVNHSNDPLNDFAPTCGGKPAGLGGADDRCGHGPRQPLLVVSPYAKSNYISHQMTDLSSPLKFIEENWGTGGIPDTLGQKSYDDKAGSLNDMFDFENHGSTSKICLSPVNGTVVAPVGGLCPTVP